MKSSRLLIIAVLFVVLLLCLLGALLSGAMAVPLGKLFASLRTNTSESDFSLWFNILIDLRLPRSLLAILAGAALAAAGTLMQALFRNPLAEPGLTGVSSGAALGAVCTLCLAPITWPVWPSAIMGALLASSAAWRLGRNQTNSNGLLLAGIAINAICASLIGLLSSFSSDRQLRSITFWSAGSFAYADWPTLAWLSPLILLLLIFCWFNWQSLNGLLLGEREAGHLGFNLPHVRLRLFLLCVLLVAPLTALCGSISFVGLIAPHLGRLLLGAQHRWLLPGATLLGAILVLLADWISRIAMPPAELPIGLLTSLLGGPFFLWLLVRRNN